MSRFPHAVLAFSNAGTLVVALVCNGLANALPLNGRGTGELSALYPNLFVPAAATFSIWALIYTGLLLSVGYGLDSVRRGRDPSVLVAIGPWLSVNLLANAAWIFAWHWTQVGLSVLLMAVILGTLMVVHIRLGVGSRAVSRAERWLVHVPVSIYLGWISVASIANITAWAVDLGVPAFGSGPAALTAVVLAVAVGLGGAMLWRCGDWAYAAVVGWALAGIAVKRAGAAEPGSIFVAATAAAGLGLLVLGILGTLWRVRSRR